MVNLLLWISTAWALQVQLRAEPPVLTAGQAGSVSVIVISGGRGDAEPASRRPPRLPTESGLLAEFAGQAQEFRNVNGRITRIQRFEYRLTATAKGTWTVGPVDVPLDDGTIAHSEPIEVVVNDRPTGPAAGPAPEYAIDVAFDDTTLWEGQVAVLRAKFQTSVPGAQVHWRVPDWNGLQLPQQAAPAEDGYTVADPDLGTVRVQDVRVPLLAVATGERSQGVVSAEVTIPVPGGGLFAFARGRTEHVVSDPLSVTVQPLPPRPPGFTGLVGDVEVRSEIAVNPSGKVAVGQSVPWTLTMTGAASFEGFDLADYQAPNTLVYSKGVDRAARFDGERFQGTAVFRRIIVPTVPGTLQLPPLQLVVFSPTEGRYVTHTVELPALEVLPGESVETRLESFERPADPNAALDSPVVQVRPPYTWGRATAPSLAPLLPPLLALAAGPGLFVLGRAGAAWARAQWARRRKPKKEAPRVSSLLDDLPDEPFARVAALDAALRQLEGLPGADPARLRALRLRLGRVRFGDGAPDPTLEDDLRAAAMETEP